MVRTETGMCRKKSLSVVSACLVLLLAEGSVGWGMQQGQGAGSRCTFSRYLETPANRIRYENTLAKARAGYVEESNYGNAAMYGVILKSKLAANGENLDSFSAGCLTCHDGSAASNVMPTVKNTPKKNMMSMFSGKHPIGMDYEQYAVTHSSLKRLDEISQDLTLVEGRVSCITCHDPLNRDNNHLVVVKSGVDLCSVCH